jgi:carboxylesterase
MTNPQPLWNPHLDGDPFFWQAGPTGILLCHGFTASTAEVRLLAEILHQQGYTISAPLLPGHKTSPEDLNRVSWKDWYAQVEADYQFIDARCEQVVVGGESMGALLALLLASEHPKIAAVLAYAPALKLRMTRANELRLRMMAPFIPYTPKANMNPNTPWQGYPVVPLKGVLELLKLQHRVLKALSAVHQPVLVIQGCNDATVHPDVPAIILEGISSKFKESAWMESSGHVVILEHELDKAAQKTIEFLDLVLAPSGSAAILSMNKT